MNDIKRETLTQIKTLFDSQKFAVLSTQKDDQPYASLVAFATAAGLDQLLFLTPKTTRKYDNLTSNSRVALLINNQKNQSEDIYNAISVTATGTAITVEDQQKEDLLEIFTNQHPRLKTFSTEPSTALVCVRVDTFFVVSEFQNVVTVTDLP